MSPTIKEMIESHLEDFGWHVYPSIDTQLVNAVCDSEDVTHEEAEELIEDFYHEWLMKYETADEELLTYLDGEDDV